VSSPIRVLLTGATGYLGRYLVEQSRAPARPGEPGLEVRTAGRAGCDHAVDLAVRSAIAPLVDAVRPDVVLHAGAVSSIAACEAAPGIAQAVNVHATAELCARAPAVVYVSTDLVFGGDRAPYGVRDPVRPLSVYGRSKAAGEEAVLASARGVVVRVPLLFGRSFDGRRGATDMIRAAAADDREVTLFVDEFRTPLHVADAAALLLSLCRVVGAGGDAPRIVHAPGRERLSRFELGRRFAECSGVRARMRGAPCTDPLRPKDVALAGEPVGRDLAAALADA